MIEISGLTKRFGALEVLRGVDLHVARGRVTAIVGPNGAGKTTLIKALLGLVRPDAGEMRVDGAAIVGDAWRARVGYMPQIARFPEHISGAELLTMLRGLRPAQAGGLDEELVGRWALAPELAKPLRTLSGGTRQKVNAVAAFLFRPDLLVLDEPTAGLDPVAAGILKEKILAARAAGCTVIVTSHVMSELEELSDDVAFLAAGRIAYTGAVADLKALMAQDTLERAVARMMTREEVA